MSWGPSGFCDGIFNEAPCHFSLAEKEIVCTPVDFASRTVGWKSAEDGWKRIEFLVSGHMAFPQFFRGEVHWPVNNVALIIFVPIV